MPNSIICLNSIKISRLMSSKNHLIVRNSKNSRNNSKSRDSSLELPMLDLTYNQANLKTSQSDDLKDRLLKLQGNLKMLEKKYKNNLKEGFESKIKAYRLQAVIQRKFLKQAIQQAHATIGQESLKEKLERTAQLKQIKDSRVKIINQQREERANYLKAQMQNEKQSITLSLYEGRKMSQKINRQIHDKILEEEEHVDRKKKYLDYLRKMSMKKEENILKRQYLQRIAKNTQYLRDLKKDLQEIQESNQTTKMPNPFITI